MIDLQKEAEELAGSAVFFDCSHSYASYYKGVIAGANSKYVQAEKLRAQIKICNNALNWSNEPNQTTERLNTLLNTLKEQLKNIENDTNRNE